MAGIKFGHHNNYGEGCMGWVICAWQNNLYSCAEDNLNGTLSNAVGHIVFDNM